MSVVYQMKCHVLAFCFPRTTPQEFLLYQILTRTLSSLFTHEREPLLDRSTLFSTVSFFSSLQMFQRYIAISLRLYNACARQKTACKGNMTLNKIYLDNDDRVSLIILHDCYS